MNKIMPLMAAACMAVIAGPAFAQAGPTPVRGTLTSVTSEAIAVKGKDGKTTQIALAPNYRVALLKPISIEAIQPGSFVGTAEVPGKNGTGRSLEVHVLPPGSPTGHFPWNLKPGSMMTNGTVGKVTTKGRGREIDVSYPTGTRHITVPANVPIVQFGKADPSMLKVGTPIFTVPMPKPDGGLVTGLVAVGQNGATPPM